MNTFNTDSNVSTRHTQQPSITQSNLDGYLNGLMASGVIIASIMLAVLIIWIWSMFSMINLNIRFKDFYEEYMRNNPNLNDQNNAVSHKETTNSPINDDASEVLPKPWYAVKPSWQSWIVLALVGIILIAILVSVSTQH